MGLSMLFTLSAICSLILKHFQKMVKLGDTVPNFTAATTHGKIDFHTWIEGSWSILFSHPADYTPVCTTELGRAQAMSGEFAYPIIADPSREIAMKYSMLDPVAKDNAGMPLTCRAVFVIGPVKKLKLSILYPATTGRNFDEIIRAIDSLQLTARRKVATPVDWRQGGQVIVAPSVKPEDAPGLFPKGVKVHELPSGKGYLRTTPQPE